MLSHAFKCRSFRPVSPDLTEIANKRKNSANVSFVRVSVVIASAVGNSRREL